MFFIYLSRGLSTEGPLITQNQYCWFYLKNTLSVRSFFKVFDYFFYNAFFSLECLFFPVHWFFLLIMCPISVLLSIVKPVYLTLFVHIKFGDNICFSHLFNCYVVNPEMSNFRHESATQMDMIVILLVINVIKLFWYTRALHCGFFQVTRFYMLTNYGKCYSFSY